jgi:hypothetical protein
MLLIKDNKPSMVIRDQLMSFVSRDESDTSTKTATAK